MFKVNGLRLVIITLLVLSFVSGAGIADAQNKTDGLIAFYSNRSGNKDIWIIKPDGTGLSQLTSEAEDDLLPTWSPDAKRIAFTSLRDGDNGIYTMNSNGTNQKRLIRDHGGSPIWSPDGKKIQYTSTKSGTVGVYIVNADGTGEKHLNIKLKDSFGFFNWSADSKKLIYSAGDGNAFETFDLYEINVDGTGEQKVFKDDANRVAPAWSPDGKQIAYSQVDPIAHKGEIYVSDVDGSNARRVTHNELTNIGATWSPDGKKLAYTGGQHNAANIYVVNVDGSGERQLTKGSFTDNIPVWSAVTPALKLPLPAPKAITASAGADCPLKLAKDKTYGYTEDNPINVGGGDFEGPFHAQAYLEALRGPKGEKVTYDRQGSKPNKDSSAILDGYEVSYKGLKKPILLWVNQYSEERPQIPIGFTCSIK